jgi:hypothetical protein
MQYFCSLVPTQHMLYCKEVVGALQGNWSSRVNTLLWNWIVRLHVWILSTALSCTPPCSLSLCIVERASWQISRPYMLYILYKNRCSTQEKLNLTYIYLALGSAGHFWIRSIALTYTAPCTLSFCIVKRAAWKICRPYILYCKEVDVDAALRGNSKWVKSKINLEFIEVVRSKPWTLNPGNWHPKLPVPGLLWYW